MTRYDHLEIRCPRLGGEVTFAYCRKEASDLPCARIIYCWGAALPVETYLQESLGGTKWEIFCLQVPRDKVATLIDLAQTAKKIPQ
jgi:hypothetical protein